MVQPSHHGGLDINSRTSKNITLMRAIILLSFAETEYEVAMKPSTAVRRDCGTTDAVMISTSASTENKKLVELAQGSLAAFPVMSPHCQRCLHSVVRDHGSGQIFFFLRHHLT